MAANWTRSWSGTTADRTDADREIGVEYHVRRDDAALTIPDIYNSVALVGGAPFPQIGDPNADDPYTYVNRISAPRFIGPRDALVTVVYRTRKPNSNSDDPLSWALRYRPSITTRSEPTDVDVDGNPIVNSALDTFSSSPNGVVRLVTITAARNEQGWDPTFAIGFVGRINSDTFSIGGKTVHPGQALMESIEPEREYTLADPFVPVRYMLSFTEAYAVGDGVKYSGHHVRLLDKGRRALAYLAEGGVVKPVEILTGEGGPLTDDVLLNGHGAPLHPNKYTFQAKLDNPGVQAIRWHDGADPPAGAAVAATSTGAVALIYRRHKAVPFSPLNL